jgi:type II secretory pathway component GspD/PulD (secretin)
VVKGASEPIHYSIQDFAVVFSPGKAPQPLFSRVFAVNVQSLAAGMKQVGVNLAGQTNSTAQIMLAFRRYVSGLGVEWEAPPGKTIFYSDGKERLMVKATEGDLNIIEHAIDKLLPPPPQIHIKARFVEVPKGTTSAFGQFPGPTNSPNGGFTGILSSTNARVMLRALESRNDVEFIAEPECTTLGGRQTQMRATEQIDVITGVSFEQQVEMPGVVVTNGVSFKTEKVEVGPILDVVPNVLADGHTINLTVIPSVTEFLGYEETTNMTPSVAATGQGMKYPSMRPSFRVRQFPANVNLWNGQTLILGGLPEKYITAGEEVNDKSKRSDKELLIFITATIVDPAGNRVHNEKDGYFDPMGIPPQPVSK